LVSITNGITANMKPDFYDGARPDDIDAAVSNDLNSLIIPSSTNTVRRLVAPSFFLEAKAPWGGADIVKRQAGLDGVLGTRAIYALQNYGTEEPAFDGNIYTYSSTYIDGQLKLYTYYVTLPTAPGGRPKYYMSQIKAFALTSDRDTFVQGATAFRNARDLAQGYHNSFIQTANARARNSDVEVPPDAEITVAVGDEESTDEFVDCEDSLLQPVGTDNYAAPGDVDEEPALPQYLCMEEEEPS